MMEHSDLSPIELVLQQALRSANTDGSLTSEEIVEVAEQGRRHPLFDRRMAEICQSPSALALYTAVRETAPRSGLRNVAGVWMEGLRRLPAWFDMVVSSLQQTPNLAYRAAPAAVSSDLRLISPDPTNQSVFEGEQAWLAAGEPGKVAISVEESRVGERRTVTVTLTPTEETWTLSAENTYIFRVLNREETERAAWAIECASESPVAAGIVLRSVGMFAEAERLIPNWPADPELQAFADSIRDACQARRADARRLYP